MTHEEEDALRAYIDSKIPESLQSQYAYAIGMIRGGFIAALEWMKQKKAYDAGTTQED